MLVRGTGESFPRRFELQRDYLLVQEFLPGNGFDTRITVIGNRAFGFRRFNRPDDFRASGSGRIDWNPAAIVCHRDRASILVEGDDDVGGEAVHRLINGVVEHFPDEVMQPGRADAADVHARAFANGLEPFENRNVFSGVCH